MAATIRIAFFSLCLLQLSCTAPSYTDLLIEANGLASAAGFNQQVVVGGLFQFHSYHKMTKPGGRVTLYIEGDGRAWATRYRVSLNPTPNNPLALKLALADTVSDNIIYLARPCQYRPTGQDKACVNAKYWTLHRYSQEVVSSLSAAIDQLQQQYRFKQFQLVGFSGGGALAVLVSARRGDIAALRTVAANLDIIEFSRWNKASPLTASLNPVDFAEQITHIPQQHFSGGQDRVVTWQQVAKYREKLNRSRCAEFIRIEEAGHHQGWLQRWSQLLLRDFNC